jgi:chromosome segregation ATPase
MGEHDEIYGAERLARLEAMLRELAERIQSLQRTGRLLEHAAELQRRLGDLRSELFHYEVRGTYDTPEIAESRRLVEDARRGLDLPTPEPEDDEPWRQRPE